MLQYFRTLFCMHNRENKKKINTTKLITRRIFDVILFILLRRKIYNILFFSYAFVVKRLLIFSSLTIIFLSINN